MIASQQAASVNSDVASHILHRVPQANGRLPRSRVASSSAVLGHIRNYSIRPLETCSPFESHLAMRDDPEMLGLY